MIYSFYGRLSVGNMDPDWLAEGDLPPTFYVYGTEDPSTANSSSSMM